MKGDFSRSTFRKEKQYRKVHMQQGRVQLDSDWNEQVEIAAHYERTALKDIMGDSGTSLEGNGFSITTNEVPLFIWDNVPGTDSDQLKKFLKQNFNLLWLDAQNFVKNTDKTTISISEGEHSIMIELDPDKKGAILSIDRKEVFCFYAQSRDNVMYMHSLTYWIGEGRLYVDGILCENEAKVDVFNQKDLPGSLWMPRYFFNWDNVPGKDDKKLSDYLKQNFKIEESKFVKSPDERTISPEKSGTFSLTLKGDKSTAINPILTIGTETFMPFFIKRETGKINVYGNFNIDNYEEPGILLLVYLDVWERHLTALEDPDIAEVALGGADTTTRSKIIWQVKHLYIGKTGESFRCNSSIPAWDDLVRGSTGKLQARSKKQENIDKPCIFPPGAGYRGIENQLYRVEIHDPGETGKGATFTWSRNNGMAAAPLKDISLEKLTISGSSTYPGFAPEQWIEVRDDLHELWGLPGTMARLSDVLENTLIIDLNSVTGDPLNNDNYLQEFRPKVRLWDSQGCTPVEIPAQNDGYIELEDGIEIKFAQGTYETDDYWLIPARTVKGDIEWPKTGDTPAALPPEGIVHHYSRLALIELDKDWIFHFIADCRKFFPSTTALNGLAANTGIISLTIRKDHGLIFGPFSHFLENLSVPPAIMLGQINDPLSDVDLEGSYQAVNANLKTFNILVPSPSERETNINLRWWAIPGQEHGIQLGKPVPSITFDPVSIRIGGAGTIRVIDPKAGKDPLKAETIEVIVTVTISATEIVSKKVNAVETSVNSAIFEVQIQVIDNNIIKIGEQTLQFSRVSGCSIAVAYWYFADGIQRTVTDTTTIPESGKGSIAGKVSDDSGKEIINAILSIKDTSISAATNTSGDYILDNVTIGDHEVTASTQGYVDSTQTVNVSADKTINVNFIMKSQTGTITGTITDLDTSSMISGATLSVDGTSISTTTDQVGKYTLSGVPVGQKTVKVNKAGYFAETKNVTVMVNQSVSADFVLSKRCTAGNPNIPCLGGKPDKICPADEFIHCLAGSPQRCVAGKPQNLFPSERRNVHSLLERPEVKPREGDTG